MRVFLVNENNPTAMSLIEKLANVKHGQMIPVSPEELKFFRTGNFVTLDLPEDVTKVTLSMVPAQEKPKEPTSDPKPPGTSPKSPVA